MAQDVALWGVAYADVPQIKVPKQGGGLATFTDTSDTTAQAADVAQGKQFHDATGELVTGTASGGGGGLDADFKATIERDGAITSLPSDLTKVGDYAFRDCADLSVTSLPSGVTSIGNYAFYECTRLTLTSLPSSVTSIGQYAFYQCTNLALTSLPSSLISIEQRAFLGCTSLALTSFPSSVTSIGNYAFSGCTGLRGVLTLPSSLTSIGSYAFQSCRDITKVTCDGPLTFLGTETFKPNSTSTVHRMLITEALFPNAVINSHGTTFGNATTGYACKLLTTVDLGKTKALAANAFANCNALTTLVLRKDDAICTLANVSAFTNTPMRGYSGRTGTIYVPQALIETYKTATNWSTIYDAGYLTFAPIEGSEWELD